MSKLFKKVQLKGPRSGGVGDSEYGPFTISPNPNIRPLAQNAFPRPRKESSRVYTKVLEELLDQEDDIDDREDENYVRDPDETSRIWASMREKQVQQGAASEDSRSSYVTCVEGAGSSVMPVVAKDAELSDTNQLRGWKNLDTLFESECNHFASQITQTDAGGNFEAWKKFFKDYCEVIPKNCTFDLISAYFQD